MKPREIVQRIQRDIHDPLKTFRMFQRLIAAICIGIPFFLWLADTNRPPEKFRSSISNYVYMPHSYFFGMLLCVAAMLFIFNGAVYFRREEKFELKSQGKWYNVVLGLALLGVISLPHEEFEFPHYLFAGIFFLGNVFVIAFLHNKKQRVFRAILAILTILSLAFHFIFGWISLFWGEWLSLAVIGIHFILEARNVKR